MGRRKKGAKKRKKIVQQCLLLLKLLSTEHAGKVTKPEGVMQAEAKMMTTVPTATHPRRRLARRPFRQSSSALSDIVAHNSHNNKRQRMHPKLL